MARASGVRHGGRDRRPGRDRSAGRRARAPGRQLAARLPTVDRGGGGRRSRRDPSVSLRGMASRREFGGRRGAVPDARARGGWRRLCGGCAPGCQHGSGARADAAPPRARGLPFGQAARRRRGSGVRGRGGTARARSRGRRLCGADRAELGAGGADRRQLRRLRRDARAGAPSGGRGLGGGTASALRHPAQGPDGRAAGGDDGARPAAGVDRAGRLRAAERSDRGCSRLHLARGVRAVADRARLDSGRPPGRVRRRPNGGGRRRHRDLGDVVCRCGAVRGLRGGFAGPGPGCRLTAARARPGLRAASTSRSGGPRGPPR